MPAPSEALTVADLQERYRAGEFVVTFDSAKPWKIVACSRSAWFRFAASPDAPAGMCLKLGHGRRLALGPFLRWIGADNDATGGEAL